jgi:hypothetical protein
MLHDQPRKRLQFPGFAVSRLNPPKNERVADRRTSSEGRGNTSLIRAGSLKHLDTIPSKHHSIFAISSKLTPIEGDDMKIVVAIINTPQNSEDVMIVENIGLSQASVWTNTCSKWSISFSIWA